MPEPVRMICREAGLDTLLAELVVHRFDLVLADRPIPPTSRSSMVAPLSRIRGFILGISTWGNALPAGVLQSVMINSLISSDFSTAFACRKSIA